MRKPLKLLKNALLYFEKNTSETSLKIRNCNRYLQIMIETNIRNQFYVLKNRSIPVNTE